MLPSNGSMTPALQNMDRMNRVLGKQYSRKRWFKMNPKSIFRLDRKFINQLHRRILKTDRQFFGESEELSLSASNSLPTADQIEQIILTLFSASIQHEEGRLSRFRVGFSEPMPLDDLALVFERPKLWSVEEIRKLAPAIVPPNGHLGLWQFKYLGLCIWGIQTLTPLGVTFEVLEPGRIIVSSPLGHKIAEITAHKAGFISDEWQRGGYELMSSNQVTEEQPRRSPAAIFFPKYAMQEILRRIRLLRHGGTLIIVPNDISWKTSIEKPVMYECRQPLNQINSISNYFTNQIEEIEKTNDIDRITKDRRAMELFSDYKIKSFLSDATRSIAYLSAVDGAVILDSTLAALSFGVRLRKSRKGARAKTVINIPPLDVDKNYDEHPLEQVFRGTRHLSAAQFIYDNPGAVAFVISQDGAITGLRVGSIEPDQSKPKLLAYRNLELLL